MSEYRYYPGCSQQVTAQAYDISAKKVCDVLDIGIHELEDWNCCGATEYFTVNRLAAYSLVARNLSIAANNNIHELVAPCSACYFNLRRVDDNMAKHPKLAEKVNKALSAGGLHYQPGSLRIRHLLDVIIDDVGYEKIEDKVVQKLTGLRIAPYYGCLVARPYPNNGDGSDYPTRLDKLMTVLGAIVVNYPVKTRCCGGHMTQISEETAFEAIRRLLKSAVDNEADVIAVLCPMCQLNLDAYQSQVNHMFQHRFLTSRFCISPS